VESFFLWMLLNEMGMLHFSLSVGQVVASFASQRDWNGPNQGKNRRSAIRMPFSFHEQANNELTADNCNAFKCGTKECVFCASYFEARWLALLRISS